MNPSAFNYAEQQKLKSELQGEPRSAKLEKLAAALLSRLLDVPIAVSQSGFQHGGDAGPAGQQGRRFRLECKKYSDTTSLSERELLGEIDHALARDPALEGWFLIATRQVPEQLAQALLQKGEDVGVPVVIIDWEEHDLARLAALCAFAPDLVETFFSPSAAASARALGPDASETIASLRRQLQAWCLGFASLRSQSHAKLLGIWNDPRTSDAELGQNAAGGAHQHKVRRLAPDTALNAWWQGEGAKDAPAVLCGADGVGKTWTALDWLVECKDEQPIVLVVPSSAVATMTSLSESVVKRFIAERLLEVTGVRGVEHWQRRLGHLFTRPKTEGPILTILFDGMNQEPSVAWLPLLKILQGPAFDGRVRVLASTRTHHFNDKLSRLRGLIVAAVPIAVDIYDASPGGELDQMLAFEGLTRGALHPELVELARTPRLFKLVVRFRERLVDAGRVTVHRLLWEYGRDSFGERAGKSFSEPEWQDWLRDIARQHRDGVREFSLKALGETARRADLTEREVYARLSDIVDGRFMVRGPSGTLQFTPTVVAHALGAGFLNHLDRKQPATLTAAEIEVTQWLDPISGLDQRAEILRAAVSIMVERGDTVHAAVAGALVTAWLQTQNITDAHRRDLASLSVHIPAALLDAVELSCNRAQSSARLWAINALRAIPRVKGPALGAIIDRVRHWLCIVSRDIDRRTAVDLKQEQHRSERYMLRIGIDASCACKVLGVPLELVDQTDSTLAALIPAVLEGLPLVEAVPCFEAAAVSFAVRGQLESWAGLKWLCHLNEVDPDATGAALRDLSSAMRSRATEPGVHADLPARAAALLLWLSGEDEAEEEAARINPRFDRVWTYQSEYLAKPSRSFFELERRHANEALCDTGVPVVSRIQRSSQFWLDPDFSPPPEFIAELRRYAQAFPAESLYAEGSLTREQHIFGELEVALARCAPELLADLARRTIRSFGTRSQQARYWSAIHVTDAFILTGAAEAAAAAALRQSASDPDETQEGFAAGQLLKVEIRNWDVQAQFDQLIQTGLKFISVDFSKVIRQPTAQDVDDLIVRWGTGGERQCHDLIVLLSIHRVAFSDAAWTWLVALAVQPAHALRGVLFRMLAASDERRFGRELATRDWSWDPAAHLWVNHYGTAALMNADSGLPFDQLAPRLVPWRLLEAASLRGSDPSEVRLASEILGHILLAPTLVVPDPGSDLSVDRSDDDSTPFMVSAEPRRATRDADDPMAAMAANFNAKDHIEAYRRASDTAADRINVARKSGASLYLADIAAADMELAVQHAAELVYLWLDGCETQTADFARRVRLAEAPYLALCEALLKLDPQRGTVLWRALRQTLSTRYIGPGGIDDILHMVFRVPSSAAVETLKSELLTLPGCRSDKMLYQIALAASYNNQGPWLAAMIVKDQASPLAWQRRRAFVLSGFICDHGLPVPDAWREGAQKSTRARIAGQSARRRFQEASAHHWWRAYLDAADTEAAYAAWILFLRAADHRALVWMQSEITGRQVQDGLFNLKLAHAGLNHSAIKSAMDKRPEKLEKTFLGQDIVRGIGPWVVAD